MDSQLDINEMQKPLKSAVFIPTNLPLVDDPRDISKRALARFRIGADYARQLRALHGRANVSLVIFGGWPLHTGIPLSIQHVYAAVRIHRILQIDEIDFIASYGINSVTDLHGTLQWMKDNILDIRNAYVVTSKGHATRLVAESNMQSIFNRIYHIESHEERDSEDEDERWVKRANNVPPHQYVLASRASEVSRFGSLDSLEWVKNSKKWAVDNPNKFKGYTDDLWNFVKDLEENNVAVRIQTPGGWKISINC